MRDEPSGAALLDAAQRTLAEQVVPALSGDARYAALMVANAMRIVAREIEQEPRAARAREALLSRAGDASPGGEAAQATRLVQAIRAGALDADPALYAALLESTAVAAGIWKPALLAAAGREEAGGRRDAEAGGG